KRDLLVGVICPKPQKGAFHGCVPLSSFDPYVLNPTASFIFDLSTAGRYAPPTYPVYLQEAPDVTSQSDREGRLCHSHVCPRPQRCGRVPGGTVGIPVDLSRLFCA